MVTKADRLDPDDEFDTVEVVVRANATGGLTTIVVEDAAGLRSLGRQPEMNDAGQVVMWVRGPGAATSSSSGAATVP